MAYESILQKFINQNYFSSITAEPYCTDGIVSKAEMPFMFQYGGDTCSGFDTFSCNFNSMLDFQNWNNFPSFSLGLDNFNNLPNQNNFSFPSFNFNNLLNSINWNFSNTNFLDKIDFSNKSTNVVKSTNTPSYTTNHTGRLFSVTEWDLRVKGKIKTTKTCNEDYISELQPEMQEKVRKLEAFAKKNGITFKICSGYRTAAEQQSLLDQYGSYRAASVNGSPHRSGKAIDISTNGILTEAQTTKLGKYAESIGMRWGGRWGGPGSRTQRERWHFDINV